MTISGNRERVRRRVNTLRLEELSPFPRCNCGSGEFYCREKANHYYTLWFDGDGTEQAYISDDAGETVYLGEFEGWWCNDCGNMQPPEIGHLLDEYRRRAEWA